MADLDPVKVHLFVKEPGERPVKTRLAAGVGREGALAFYRACLARLVDELATPPAGLEPVLLVAPPERTQAFAAALGWAHAARPQHRGDLGARMLDAFEAAGGPAMVLGSDVPEVTTARLAEARDALGEDNLVIGPCGDGGYYLLAAARPHPWLFEDMPWSTPEVLPRTLARAAARGVPVHQLPPMEDIDDLDDLRGLDQRLDGAGDIGRLARQLVQAADEARR